MGAPALTSADVGALERCVAVGGVAIFPADTVYGLACDPQEKESVQRLALMKRRPADQPGAVMFFGLGLALEVLAELEPRSRSACEALLPGPVTLLLPNPAGRFPLACGSSPERLGLRVPALRGPLAALAEASWPVLASSANLHGGPDPRRLEDVPEELRDAADLVLDAGELPGTPSTVVDLGTYEQTGAAPVVRKGALPAARVAELLAAL